MIAVDVGIVIGFGVDDLKVAVERRVGDPVHDDQCPPKAVAGQPLVVVVANRLRFVDDANAAGVGPAVSKEVVVFDQSLVAVAHGQRPLAFIESIAPENILTRLVGNDLVFAVAAIEVILLDHCVRIAHRIVARSDPQSFSSVGAKDGARAEVVVVDAVVILAAFFGIQSHGEGDPPVAFAGQVVVVKTIAFAVNADPVVRFVALGIVVVVDDALGHAAVVAEIVFAPAERNDFGSGRKSIFENQPPYDQVLARHAEI